MEDFAKELEGLDEDKTAGFSCRLDAREYRFLKDSWIPGGKEDFAQNGTDDFRARERGDPCNHVSGNICLLREL